MKSGHVLWHCHHAGRRAICWAPWATREVRHKPYGFSRWNTAKLSERRVTRTHCQIGGRELVETRSERKFWSVKRGELSVLHKSRGEHTASRVFLIPALSQADLNWGLWFPRYPEGWVLCQWLWIKPSSWTWGIFPIKLLPKLIKKEIARLNKNMWTSFAYHIQYLTCEAV